MLTGIISDYLDRYGLNEGLARMKRHGYSTVDYQGFFRVEAEYEKMDDAEYTRTLTNIREAADAAGISFFQCHAPGISVVRAINDQLRIDRMNEIRRSVYGTSLLHSQYYVVHPLMGEDYAPDKTCLSINAAFLTELCDYAKQFNITVFLENMPFYKQPLSTAARVVNFVRSLHIDNLKICLDTGHSNVFGIRPSDAVREIGGELLATLHVHDNDGRSDAHRMPFEGNTDWEDFRRALKEVEYSGCLSLETTVPGYIPNALREYEEIGLAKRAEYLAN